MKKSGIILIVEDEDNERLLLRIAFRKAGIPNPIQVVNNGEEALSYLRGQGAFSDRGQHPLPALIVTDLKMPRIDGFQLLEVVKGNPLWADIAVVVLSSSLDPADLKKSYQLGADAYHPKPILLDQLISQLHAYWVSGEFPEMESEGKPGHSGVAPG